MAGGRESCLHQRRSIRRSGWEVEHMVNPLHSDTKQRFFFFLKKVCLYVCVYIYVYVHIDTIS